MQIEPQHARSERHWHAFWRHHHGEWTGRWTRYSPSGDVKETFTSSRHFTTNPSKTDIIQVNQYRYADGQTIQKEWKYNIKDHSQPDGFAHPASDSMRGLSLNNGSACWLIPTLQINQLIPFELFLVDGDIRHSVGVLYGRHGELLHTASIREHRGHQSAIGWTDRVIHVEPWNPTGRWQGEEHQIHPDLSLVPLQQSVWQWTDMRQFGHFFPDGIILRCPECIITGQAFSIQVVWLLRDRNLQTLTVDYNDNAQLISLTHQTLTPEG